MDRVCVFFIATFLFTYSLYYQEGSAQRTSYKTLYSFIFRSYNDKNTAGFHYALVTGDKSQLKAKTKKAFQKLFLLHFLTPSGLHLGFIISILCFFSRKLLWITPVLFFLDGFYAAKRVLVLFYLNQFKFDRVYVFFIFFIFDFIFGSFEKNPLSFSLSFLFLGIIYTNNNFRSLFFSFLGAQILVSFFFGQVFSFVGFALGFALTPILVATFPVYLTGFHEGAKTLSRTTIFVVESLAELVSFDATFVSFNLIIILFLLVIPWKFRGKSFLIVFTFTIHSCPIINLHSLKHLYYAPQIFRFKHISFRRTRTGYKSMSEDGSVCYLRLRNFSYEIDCR